MQQILTIGFIPPNHPGGLISCGDPQSSGTLEITLLIEEEIFTSPEIADLNINAQNCDWFNPLDTMWERLSTILNTRLPFLLTPKKLSSIWCHLMDEPIDGSTELIELNEEFGEFQNNESSYNNHLYIRYQIFEEEIYTSDKIYISEIS